MKIDKLAEKFIKVCRHISFLYLFIVFCIIIIVDKGVKYASSSALNIPNIVLLFISVILFIGIIFYLWRTRNEKEDDQRFLKTILIISFIVLVVQIVVSLFVYFQVGFDVNVLNDSAKKLVDGKSINQVYFSVYPNNVFLMTLIAGILALGKIILPINPYFLVIIVTNIIINISCLLTARLLYRMLHKKNIVYVVYATMIPLVLLSPWMTVPYSDAWGLIFPISMIYIYSAPSLSAYLKTFLIGMVSMIGYFIKPTVIIVLIAMVIVRMLMLFIKHVSMKKFFLIGITLLIGFGVSFGVKSFTVSFANFQQNKDLEIPLTHFMMMGLNPQSLGIYSRQDYNYSMSFDTKNERQVGNIEVIHDRFSSYGVSGYLKLLVKKSLSNYNDGSFSWELEGGFHYPGTQDTPWSLSFLKNYYYASGDYYQIFLGVNQVVWLLVLLTSLFAVVYKGLFDKEISMIYLAIFGLSLFLLLFECRARYLFLYLPLFSILSGIGFSQIFELVKEKKGRGA